MSSLLPESLQYLGTRTHGVIEPAVPMELEQYLRELAKTVNDWTLTHE